MKLTQDPKRYAQLLLSVGVLGRTKRKRPLTPVECAELIKKLKDEEKKSLSEISKMLGLGRPEENTSIYKKRDHTQVNQFLKLLDVSEKSRSLAGWGYEGHPMVPFTLMAHLASLHKDDQDAIIQSVYNDDKKRELIISDAKNITRRKKENPNKSINEYIEKVLKLKPVKNTTHIIVCETGESLKRFITENSNYRIQLLDILCNNMQGEFYSIDATDMLITLSMDATAYRTFHEQQYKKNVSFTKFLNSFLENKIG